MSLPVHIADLCFESFVIFRSKSNNLLCNLLLATRCLPASFDHSVECVLEAREEWIFLWVIRMFRGPMRHTKTVITSHNAGRGNLFIVG